MSPYLRAHAAYHAGGIPPWSWTEVLDFHLQCGVVISTPEAFIMARRVRSDAPLTDHFTLSPLTSQEDGDCWHIWAASGSLEALLLIADRYRAPWVSFMRRDDTLPRIYPLSRFFRRHEQQSAQDPRTGTRRPAD